MFDCENPAKTLCAANNTMSTRWKIKQNEEKKLMNGYYGSPESKANIKSTADKRKGGGFELASYLDYAKRVTFDSYMGALGAFSEAKTDMQMAIATQKQIPAYRRAEMGGAISRVELIIFPKNAEERAEYENECQQDFDGKTYNSNSTFDNNTKYDPISRTIVLCLGRYLTAIKTCEVQKVPVKYCLMRTFLHEIGHRFDLKSAYAGYLKPWFECKKKEEGIAGSFENFLSTLRNSRRVSNNLKSVNEEAADAWGHLGENVMYSRKKKDDVVSNSEILALGYNNLCNDQDFEITRRGRQRKSSHPAADKRMFEAVDASADQFGCSAKISKPSCSLNGVVSAREVAGRYP
jgi:hypothetical protein